MPVYEVTLKPIEKHTIAAIRENVPTIEQMPECCSEMFDTVAKWMTTNHLPFGPAMTIYHTESFVRENIDTECAFIIPDPVAARKAKLGPRIQLRDIEKVPTSASTIVTEDFYKKVAGLTPAYNAIAQWIEENGYRIVGPPRELFYGSVQSGDLTAEIQFPVEKR